MTDTAADAGADRYTVISADCHGGGDLPDYRPYLERSPHAQFDAWLAAFDNPYTDLRGPDAARNWDHDRRLAELEADGVAAEVIFPNTVPPFFPQPSLVAQPPGASAGDLELRWAGLHAHNRWLADFCAAAPGRRAGIAQILLHDVDSTTTTPACRRRPSPRPVSRSARSRSSAPRSWPGCACGPASTSPASAMWGPASSAPTRWPCATRWASTGSCGAATSPTARLLALQPPAPAAVVRGGRPGRGGGHGGRQRRRRLRLRPRRPGPGGRPHRAPGRRGGGAAGTEEIPADALRCPTFAAAAAGR